MFDKSKLGMISNNYALKLLWVLDDNIYYFIFLANFP